MASRRALNALPLRSALHKPAPAFATPAVRPRYQPTSSSSTQALAYKALHRRIAPLPTSDAPPSWSAPAAVSSILYETPLPSQAPPKRHVLNCLVQNEPGVLSRVSGILAARGFNIDSLVVCNTEVPDLSRMTIVLQGQDGVVEQARRQLEDLVPVWAVLDYTQAPLVQRELLLAKVSILGPEYFEELMQHHREMVDSPGYIQEGESAAELADKERAAQRAATDSLKKDFHPSKLAASQALRHKHEHLEAITHLTHQFGGKVLDISTNNCIVEVSAKPARIDSFMKLVAPFGILESARTGLMALPRSPLAGPDEVQEKEIEDVVDQSMLPPG
ncbi:putative mitochondrial acetolactate synthase small subunit protein [Botryosphaeria dothidea]|uniref:Mitochondrial acetolactate synthase small subunit protein n=1 Tax=Botryosphaeria dothidea TaxID=55169 RepID=A0A8H4J7H0_9PEZI|nr:putative mitochondrial acetolactate synthase small subunit protein [Botryosphaeria dothidea]